MRVSLGTGCNRSLCDYCAARTAYFDDLPILVLYRFRRRRFLSQCFLILARRFFSTLDISYVGFCCPCAAPSPSGVVVATPHSTSRTMASVPSWEEGAPHGWVGTAADAGGLSRGISLPKPTIDGVWWVSFCSNERSSCCCHLGRPPGAPAKGDPSKHCLVCSSTAAPESGRVGDSAGDPRAAPQQNASTSTPLHLASFGTPPPSLNHPGTGPWAAAAPSRGRATVPGRARAPLAKAFRVLAHLDIAVAPRFLSLSYAPLASHRILVDLDRGGAYRPFSKVV